MSNNRKPAIGDNPSMQCTEMMENLQSGGKSRGKEINQQQSRPADNDGFTRNENTRARSKMWRETEIEEANEKIPNEGYAKTNEEDVDNGPKKLQTKPKIKKWKLQARVKNMEKGGSSEQINAKRPSSETLRRSPDNKKKRLLSSFRQTTTKINYVSP